MRAACLTVLLTLLLACGYDTRRLAPHGEGADAGVTGIVPLASLGRLRVDNHYFRDELGRAVILRGVNVRVAGVFDVTFDDGRTPLEFIPRLEASDCKRMAELGFRLVRLPINWSGIEPQRDEFDEAYMKRVDEVVRCLGAQKIYTLLDIHQDAYSKEIGEDGAPLWAIIPKPPMLLEGPLGDSLTARRVSGPVLSAFASFFARDDVHGLQAQYIEMLEYVAARYARDDSVIGIDLFNEPVADANALGSFNARAAQAVRRVAPDMIVVFEPTALWDQRGGEPVAGREMPVTGAMFAPHIYDLVIGGTDEQLKNMARDDVEPSFQAAREEASDWGTPWMIGEFGAGPSVANYDRYLTLLYDLQDEYLVSSALWLWKEDSQGKWGLFERRDGSFHEREEMVRVVSRPYAVRVAGTPTKMSFSADALVVSFEDAVDASSVLFIPERYDLGAVRCDGQAVPVERGQAGTIAVSCGGTGAHEISAELKAR